jgi:phosphatidate cytidylyltransferase
LHLLKRILTAVVLIPIVLLLVLHVHVIALELVAAVVALLSVYELIKLSEGYGIKPFRWQTFVFIAAVFAFLAANSAGQTPLLSTANLIAVSVFAACIATFLFLTLGMLRADLSTSFQAAMVSAFSFSYIALPFIFLVQLRQQPSGAIWVMYLLVLVWAGDIFAYFVGKSMGKHLMSPRVSPKKTWEGAIASLLASIGVGFLLHQYGLQISSALLNAHLIEQKDGFFALQKPPLFPILVLSAVLNVAAQLGDLVESLIKRGANVKDSGTILPGHGGMLDRIDALLFAAPILWFYTAWHVLQ